MSQRSDELASVRDALRRMAWELDLEQPAAPVPPSGEGVDLGGREGPSERDIETLNEIDDLTNLLADHAISTILLEANLGADLNAAVDSGLIGRAQITFATDEEGEAASYKPLADTAATERLGVTTRLLSNLAALRVECGVDQPREGYVSALRPPRLSPTALRDAVDYLREYSTLRGTLLMEPWYVNERGWEAWR